MKSKIDVKNSKVSIYAGEMPRHIGKEQNEYD
jgi:hypothetical protein